MTAFAADLHDRRVGAHAVDDAVQVDAQHPVPVVFRGLLDGTARGHPGVVADDVDPAIVVAYGLGNVLDLAPVAHIATEGLHVDVGGLELGVSARECVPLDVEHRDVDTRARERAYHA